MRFGGVRKQDRDSDEASSAKRSTASKGACASLKRRVGEMEKKIAKVFQEKVQEKRKKQIKDN